MKTLKMAKINQIYGSLLGYKTGKKYLEKDISEIKSLDDLSDMSVKMFNQRKFRKKKINKIMEILVPKEEELLLSWNGSTIIMYDKERKNMYTAALNVERCWPLVTDQVVNLGNHSPISELSTEMFKCKDSIIAGSNHKNSVRYVLKLMNIMKRYNAPFIQINDHKGDNFYRRFASKAYYLNTDRIPTIE